MRRLPVILCTFMLVLTLVAWVDGARHQTQFYYGTRGNSNCMVVVGAGVIEVTVTYGYSADQGFNVIRQLIPIHRFDNASTWVAGFGGTWNQRNHFYSLSVPYWFIALAFAAYPGWRLYRRVRYGQVEEEAGTAEGDEA